MTKILLNVLFATVVTCGYRPQRSSGAATLRTVRRTDSFCTGNLAIGLGPEMTAAQEMTRFVAVGGLGGSGTRVIALILQKMGYYLGPAHNPQMDCILFTLMFKRRDWIDRFPGDAELDRMIAIFAAAMREGVAQAFAILDEGEAEELFEKTRDFGVTRRRFEQMLASPPPDPAELSNLAWKEPNTHVFLPRLIERLPNLKYVHVIRNGLDMALSGNRQQLANWGGRYGVDSGAPLPSTEMQLRYWLAANRRVIEIGKAMKPGHFYLLNYDDLCADFSTRIEPFQAFLDRRLSASDIAELNHHIGSDSIGRFRDAPEGTFSAADRAAVRAMGFAVD